MDDIPIPVDELPLEVKQALISTYSNLVLDLANRLVALIAFRLQVDSETGEDLGGRVDWLVSIDKNTEELLRAKMEAESTLTTISELYQEYGDNTWIIHSDKAGDFLERLIRHKVDCEYELLGLDVEEEMAVYRKSAEA